MFRQSRILISKAPALAPAAIAAFSVTQRWNDEESTVTLNEAPTVNIDKVKAAIANLIEEDSEKRQDGTTLTGTLVRLAWHSAGTFSKLDNSGGCDGARMRFSPEKDWGANAGLHVGREALEQVKNQFPNLSYADLYALAGVVAIEEAGGPTIPFRLGRSDVKSGETSPPDGRLPAADKGSTHKTIDHIREIFHRMGFDDREIVALIGAHAVGRCHTDASGYWGPWTFSENTFSNEYFRLLLEEQWVVKKSHNGKPWKGPMQYEDKTGQLMMLPSDLALVQDPTFKKYVELYAKDEDAFFKDFAKAFSKLIELGVHFPLQKPWYQFW